MPVSTSFLHLLDRLRAGDEDAAGQVYRRFALRLVACAARQLDDRLRRKEDPEDVVQSVFRTFYRRVSDEQFRLDNWESLGGLLVSITVHKCLDRRRHYHRGRRDVAREETLLASGPDESLVWDPPDREPSPEEAALLAEVLTRALRGFDERERRVVEFLLQGLTPAEIAQQTECSESTVFRVQRRFRKHLEALRDENDS